MSNKAQLQINNTELSTLIETLRGKAAGGDTSVELQEKTVTPTTAIQEVQPDTGYDGLSKVTINAIPTATQATPSITVSSAGKITATSTQSAGYVAAGTKTATKQLTVQAAQTITPGTSNKTIASGRYLTGTQTIKGDANLKAANIAAGVSIFGVTGTHSGGGTDTSDATATAADIVEGETAYVNGTKLTGTNPYEKTTTDTEVNSQATKLAELKTILAGKASGSGSATLETGTLTGATSYIVIYGNCYYDLSSFTNKLLVCLKWDKALGVFSRTSTEENFSLTAQSYSSSAYEFSMPDTNIVQTAATSLTYWAV